MSFHLTWPASTVQGHLQLDEAHVWAWALDPALVDVAAEAALLDEVELHRLQRFYFAEDRARYALAHANMRRILGAYLDLPPTAVAFQSNPYGKPELKAGISQTALCFSLSHSKTVAALAVVREGPVGIDVEDVRPIEEGVAASHFSTAENAELNQLRGEEWLLGFYRCWTRKEALLKGEGVGLHRALDGFDVSIAADAPPALLASREPFSHPWTLYDVSPATDTLGALATAHKHQRLSLFRFVSL